MSKVKHSLGLVVLGSVVAVCSAADVEKGTKGKIYKSLQSIATRTYNAEHFGQAVANQALLEAANRLM